MGSVVAGGLFNAIAFAGAGYVFHKLDRSDYEAKMERHNKAMERLNKEKDLDKDLDKVNEALHNLRTATEDLEEDKEPTLDEYYEPSDEMKK